MDEPRRAHCKLCDERVPVVDLLHHMHTLHPAWDAEPEKWPDSGVVIFDETGEFD